MVHPFQVFFVGGVQAESVGDGKGEINKCFPLRGDDIAVCYHPFSCEVLTWEWIGNAKDRQCDRACRRWYNGACSKSPHAPIYWGPKQMAASSTRCRFSCCRKAISASLRSQIGPPGIRNASISGRTAASSNVISATQRIPLYEVTGSCEWPTVTIFFSPMLLSKCRANVTSNSANRSGTKHKNRSHGYLSFAGICVDGSVIPAAWLIKHAAQERYSAPYCQVRKPRFPDQEGKL